MNLRDYYREISEVESKIPGTFALVISLETSNGGREGMTSEVNRATAAKMIVEKKARLATPEEVSELRTSKAEAQRLQDISALQERVRMTRLAEDELRALKRALHPTRKGE